MSWWVIPSAIASCVLGILMVYFGVKVDNDIERHVRIAMLVFGVSNLCLSLSVLVYGIGSG